jgi:hypothetical protein
VNSSLHLFSSPSIPVIQLLVMSLLEKLFYRTERYSGNLFALLILIASWGSEGLWAGATAAIVSLLLIALLSMLTKNSRNDCRGPNCCAASPPRARDYEMNVVAPSGNDFQFIDH